MTTETRKRIRAYKRMLPELRERVVAVALLLAMSASMMGTASYAWLTISRRPEVTGASTTIAANGNLEIALATGNGVVTPDESKVGDSSAAEGQSITKANTTWGNLINLSDPSYGLESLVLRPAMLNIAELLTSPLWGADYSQDGRITQMNSNFGYTSWQIDPNVGGRFAVSDEHGVRAVSSMVYDTSSSDAALATEQKNIRAKNGTVKTNYESLASKENMGSLAKMMGLYMTARMNPNEEDLSNPNCDIKDIETLASMYASFTDVMEQEADAIAAVANYVQMSKHGVGNYTPVTASQILGINGETKLTEAALKNMGVTVTRLTELQNDYTTISTDGAKLDEIASAGGTLKWKDSGLNTIVDHLVNVGECTIGSDNTPIKNIGASNAASYISGTQEARITNGILYRFEERVGGYLDVKELSISATVRREVLGIPITVPATVKANIKTTASREYNLFTNDFNTTIANTGGTALADLIAQDTYGLAIDFWVRTNAQNSYLMLEGNLLTETETVEATIKNTDGEEVPLYTVTTTITDNEGNTSEFTQDVYEGKVIIIDENEQPQEVDGWLSAETHTAVTLEEGVTPIRKMVEVVTVLGYEGENRIWDGNEAMLSADATTQGSGSCYVYYADTPEDQARSLKLLEAFNVAFVDSDGKLLTTAQMDVEHHHAENGRVVVPLKLVPSESIDLGVDLQGNQQYGITELAQNTPTRITAIVYLDGNKLTNKDVLSAADIQGQLNIQFAGSADMEPIKNQDLASQSLTVSATVDKNKFNWDSATDDMTSVVTVTVDGAEPSQVTAFFLRAINATQGSREETMTFTKNADGKWVSAYKFKSPGNYILRTVRLDGVDYELETAPEVSVEGFAISYVSCDEATNRHITVLSADNSSTVNLRMKFATNDRSRMPEKVQGRFTKEDGTAVNVDFAYNATNQEWTGKAKFLTSGEYAMQFLVLDGEYTELDPAHWHTASVTLGMRVEVYTTSPHTFKYLPSEWENEENSNRANLYMQVSILDNAGNEMPGYSGAKLTYTMRGSGTKKMDTDLTWNGTYYVGAMPNGGPGIWEFNNVTVGKNVLTNDLRSPIFTIQSPEPPQYVGHGTVAYQYVPNKDATMNVQITNSATASAVAWIQKADGTNGQWVTTTVGSEITTSDGKTANNWFFPIPKDANGYQDGNWVLTELKLWDVFDTDGTAYTEENPLIWDVSDKNIATKVVSKLNYTFGTNLSRDFGKDSSGVITGAFLQSYNIPSLNVTISDFEGNKTTEITDVKLTFAYNGGSESNGGYTRTDLNNATTGATVTIDLAGDGTNFAFTETDTKYLLYAGNYKTTLSFKMNGETVTLTGDALPNGAPTYTVWSVTPTVSITGSTNYGNSSNTTTSATVYYQVSSNTTCGVTTTNYSQPSVTIKLAGYGNASGANLTFVKSGGGDVYLYTRGGSGVSSSTADRTDKFVWTAADSDCTRYVGQYTYRNGGSDSRTAAGTLTANTLTFTDDSGKNYNFTLPQSKQITINNPD